MTHTTPTVSIGLPVYNGENFISEAVDSVLNQTFTDFELIITDNASTDKTQKICEIYAAQDKRIKYVRNKKNLGAAPNFNLAFQLSAGKYFKWLAHDDTIASDYLEKSVAILENKPEIVLCSSGVGIIDHQGKEADKYNIILQTDSNQPAKRFQSLVMDWHLCFDVFGLIRRNAIQGVEPMPGFSHGDGVLLVDLALQGKFHQIRENLFFARRHEQQSMQMFGNWGRGEKMDYLSYAEWFDSKNKGKVIYPTWRIFREYFKLINQSKNALQERFLCHIYLGRWMIRNRVPLWIEFIRYLKQLFVSPPQQKLIGS